MFGQLFWPFIAVVVVLGIIGYFQLKKRNSKKEMEDITAMPSEAVENVNDLNDHFIRARYMDKDGEDSPPES